MTERSPKRLLKRLVILQKALLDLQRYLKTRKVAPVPVDDDELWLHLDGAEFMIVAPDIGTDR